MIVADTNVISYLALPSPYTQDAERLLLIDPVWTAPLLWRSEFRNVLTLYLRKSLITLAEALSLQSEMENLLRDGEYEVRSLDVLTLTNQSGCSAYDCEFVALAQGLNVKLVTMDKKLAHQFPETALLLNAPDLHERLQHNK